MLRRLAVLLISMSVLFAGACSKNRDVAAVVNGEVITMKDFQRQLEQRKEAHSLEKANYDEKAMKEAVINEMIGRRLLVQAAKEKGITVTDDEVKKAFDDMVKRIGGQEKLQEAMKKWDLTEEKIKKNLRESLMIDKYIKQLVPEDSIKEEEMKKFYKESPRPFVEPDQVYVRLVQTTSEEKAKEILKKWKASGKDFDKFVESLPQKKDVLVSGYGWASVDAFGGVFGEALKELKPGEVGGPYKGSKGGYYILRVKKRKPGKPIPYEKAKDRIKQVLLMQKRQAMRAHLIEERKKKADIKIYVD